MQTGACCNIDSVNQTYLPKFEKAEAQHKPQFYWHYIILAGVLAGIWVSSNYPPRCGEAGGNTHWAGCSTGSMAADQAAVEVASWNGTENVYSRVRVGKLFL